MAHLQSVSSDELVIFFNPPKEYNVIDIILTLQTWGPGIGIVLVTRQLYSIFSNLYSAGTMLTT